MKSNSLCFMLQLCSMAISLRCIQSYSLWKRSFLFEASNTSTTLKKSFLAAQFHQRTRRRTTTTTNVNTSANGNDGGSINYIPELLVFDLDACFWDKEMFEMPSIPKNNKKDMVLGDLNGRGVGVIGVMSGPYQISIHKGALLGLQEHADGKKYPGMKVAFASSANTPFAEKIGRTSLKLLEVLPGLTVWDLIVNRDWNGQDVNQIGRQPPLLSPDKAASHFPNLKKLTGIRYDRMLFFDDCNWGDHCAMVATHCREDDTGIGPATVQTPYGLKEKEWRLGLETYAKQQQQ